MPTIDIKRILCPIDFSECSRHAFMYAVALAKWYKARITALHVFEPVVMPEVLPASPVAITGLFPSPDVLMADLSRFVVPLNGALVPIDMVVEEGHIARQIIDYAARMRADLVVIGTHGRSGFDHLLLGSVTEKVLRRASCPVLIVPPAVAAQPAVRFQRILCPIDFGSASRRALAYALSLAQESDAALTVLHVLESFSEETVAGPFDVPEYRRLQEADARERLRAAIPAHVRDWCHPAELLAAGKPYREILHVAQETNADLIVMGITGRGAIDIMLFGSTTNHVVRGAPCPVLTLRGTTKTDAIEDTAPSTASAGARNYRSFQFSVVSFQSEQAAK